MLAAAERMRGPLSRFAPGMARRFGELIHAARHRGQRRLFDLCACHDPLALSEFLTSKARGQVNGYVRQLLPGLRDQESLDGRDMIDATMNVALPGASLRMIDMTSMAHGLEVRVPFLGASVLDLAARLPHRWKHPGRRRNKVLLRALLQRYLPAEITAQWKPGFGIPADAGLSLGVSLDLDARLAVQALLTGREARIRALIDADYTRSVCWEFVSGESPPLP